MVGLVVPETIAFAAWNQRRAAIRLREVLGETPEPTYYDRIKALVRAHRPIKHTLERDTETPCLQNPARRYPWTMTHSFYAVMEGFASTRVQLSQTSFLAPDLVSLSS